MLIALLAALMLAQLAAMAMIANSQVERAEKRAEAERNLVVAQRAAPASTRQGAAKQVVKVGYVLAE